MVMITKAGVPSNKIIMGLPRYGRSFKMISPGCTGPMCTYAGPASGAAPGRCTGTQGYISNFEIREIISTKSGVQQFKTEEGDEIVVYDGTEWVGWMTPQKYDERSSWFRGLNMGGTSDWAIDLEEEHDVGSGPGSGGGGGGGNGGATTVIGGSTTIIGGTRTVIGGISTTIGGTTSVIGGITTTLPGIRTTVIGGTTTVIDGKTTVIGGTTSTIFPDPITTVIRGTSTTIFPNPITTVIGGTTTTIDGTRTVIGGTSTTIFPPGATRPPSIITTVIGGSTTVIGGSTTVIGGTTTTTALPPVVTGFPEVTNGHCSGPDCVNGRCIGKHDLYPLSTNQKPTLRSFWLRDQPSLLTVSRYLLRELRLRRKQLRQRPLHITPLLATRMHWAQLRRRLLQRAWMLARRLSR
jgi:hypothetical protein